MRGATTRASGLASEAEVLDRVNRVLGPVEVAEDFSTRAHLGRVFKVKTRSDEYSYVKWYKEAADFQREYDALSTYTPSLGTDAPRLIDHDQHLHMLLISAVAGSPASEAGLDWDPVVHYKAGVLIRRLHESAPHVNSDQFARTCAARFEDAAAQIEDLVESHLLQEARILIAKAMDIEHVPLVPTHRDNHPRNWMVDPGGHVRLIDFADSEYDPWIVDVLLLEQDYWRSAPHLRVAFLSGYDRDISPSDEILLRAHHAVSAVRAMAQAKHHSASKGQKLLARDMFDRLLGVTLF